MPLSARELRDVMLLFDEERHPEKKEKYGHVTAYVVKEKLDRLLFHTNIMNYVCKHPNTGESCVMSVVQYSGDIKRIDKITGGADILDGINIYVFWDSDESQIQEFLNA